MRRNLSPLEFSVQCVPIGGRVLVRGCLLALLLLLFVAGGRAQISPGPLSKAHQSLTGTTQCSSCHQFGTSTPTFKCLDCHKEVAQRLSANHGYHADWR